MKIALIAVYFYWTMFELSYSDPLQKEALFRSVQPQMNIRNSQGFWEKLENRGKFYNQFKKLYKGFPDKVLNNHFYYACNIYLYLR